MPHLSSSTHPLRRRNDPVARPVAGLFELLRADAVILATGIVVVLSFFLQSLHLDEEQRFYLEVGSDLAMVLLAIIALLAGIDG